MTQTFTLTINMLIPSELRPNRNRGGHANHHQATRLEKELARATAAGIRNARTLTDDERQPIFTEPVVCTLTIYRKPRGLEWDRDNVIAATKRGVWDVLQSCSVVANDKQITDYVIHWDKDPDKQGYMTLEVAAADKES